MHINWCFASLQNHQLLKMNLSTCNKVSLATYRMTHVTFFDYSFCLKIYGLFLKLPFPYNLYLVPYMIVNIDWQHKGTWIHLRHSWDRSGMVCAEWFNWGRKTPFECRWQFILEQWKSSKLSKPLSHLSRPPESCYCHHCTCRCLLLSYAGIFLCA